MQRSTREGDSYSRDGEVMSSMGHGEVVDLVQIASNRYEASTNAIAMEGTWMVRIKITTNDSQEQTVTFHFTVQ